MTVHDCLSNRFFKRYFAVKAPEVNTYEIAISKVSGKQNVKLELKISCFEETIFAPKIQLSYWLYSL